MLDKVFADNAASALHCVFQKHMTTSSTISSTRTVRLPKFLSHLLLRLWLKVIESVFIFPPHLLSAPTLPWETVKT